MPGDEAVSFMRSLIFGHASVLVEMNCTNCKSVAFTMQHVLIALQCTHFCILGHHWQVKLVSAVRFMHTVHESALAQPVTQ